MKTKIIAIIAIITVAVTIGATPASTAQKDLHTRCVDLIIQQEGRVVVDGTSWPADKFDRRDLLTVPAYCPEIINQVLHPDD